MTTDELELLKVRSVDGTQIACWRGGHGLPLILVHGTAADHTRWATVLPGLRERFTVWAVDRRGRGASGDAAAAYALQREADDLVAVIGAVGEPVTLLGHSYGANCAVEAVRRTPTVSGLILYEPGFTEAWFAPPGLIARLDALLAAGDGDAAVATFMREVPRVPPEQLELMRERPSWPGRVKGAHTIPRELRAIEGFRFEPAQFREVTTTDTDSARWRHTPGAATAGTHGRGRAGQQHPAGITRSTAHRHGHRAGYVLRRSDPVRGRSRPGVNISGPSREHPPFNSLHGPNDRRGRARPVSPNQGSH